MKRVLLNLLVATGTGVVAVSLVVLSLWSTDPYVNSEINHKLGSVQTAFVDNIGLLDQYITNDFSDTTVLAYTPSHHHALATPIYPRGLPSSTVAATPGNVLGQSTTQSTQSPFLPFIIHTTVTVDDNYIKSLIASYLSDPSIQASFRGPQGDKGENGAMATGQPVQSIQPSTPGPIPSVFIPGGAVQPNPAANFNGATLFSATDLSSDHFTTGNATVLHDLIVNGVITGSVSGSINPGFTAGSVVFQGASGLAQDNANLFWDDTNNRLGIGTTSPTRAVDIRGTLSLSQGSNSSNIIIGNAGYGLTGYNEQIDNVNIGGTVQNQSGGCVGCGGQNVVIGRGASTFGRANDFWNVIIGYNAASNSVSSQNVIIGANANAGASGGASVAIGANTVASGINSIAIGRSISVTTSNSLNIGNALFANLSNGNVGIGTTQPTAILDVLSTSVTGVLVERYGGTASLTFQRGNGIQGSPTAINNNDFMGQLRFGGYGATSFSGTKSALDIRAGEVWTDTAQGQYLDFSTTPIGSTVSIERLRIDPSGNVGIGTSTFGTNNKFLLNPYNTVDNLATAQISTTAATNKGLVIQGFTSQSADLQEWQDSTGANLVAIDSAGRVGLISAVDTASVLRIQGTNTNLTGTDVNGLNIFPSAPTTATSSVSGIRVGAKTTSGAFTVTDAIALQVVTNSQGPSSTITNSYGIVVRAQGAGTNKYGVAIEASPAQTLWLSSNADNTTASAGIAFGLSRDTNLYRSAASTLKTDGSFLLSGNLGINTTSQFGSGVGVIGITNATTDPTTNPTGGGVLYASSGALKWRGSSGTVTQIAAADYAEDMPTADSTLTSAEVVSVSTTPNPAGDGPYNKFLIERATKPYDPRLVGVVSSFTDLAQQPANSRPVALVGRVPVKVSTENGAIEVGDYLTASATKPGYAMKATTPGVVIGKALEASLSGDSNILVFVNPTYYVPTVATILQNNPPQDLIDLNMTAASAFGNLVVTDTLYVGAKLIVNGSIQAKEIHTDELCVGTVCVTPEQFLKMVQQSGAVDSAPVAPPGSQPETPPADPAVAPSQAGMDAQP